jgi:hypothetical protein
MHEPIAKLAMSFLASGWSTAKTVAQLRNLMDNSRAKQDRPADWKERYDDISRAVHTAQEKLQIRREQDELRRRQEAADEATMGPRAAPEQPEDLAGAAGAGAAPGQSQKAPPTPPSSPLALHQHGEVDPLDTRSWCIQDLIPEVGHGLIVGQWGTCKTFNALELSHCVMTGRSYLGFDIIRPGGVFFIALEGPSELAIRIQGVLDHKGTVRLPRAPFIWTEECPPLTQPKTADVIIKAAEVAATRLKEQFNLPLALIIVDSTVAAAGYRREGQDNDVAMTHAIMMTLKKVGHALGCFAFGIDHYGKDATVGTRGSSVKEGDADVILACLGDKDEAGDVTNLRLALRKRRSGANGEEFPFRKRVVEMGTNKHGKAETTLVLDFGTDPNAAHGPPKDTDEWGKSKAVRHLRKVLMDLMVDHGADIQPFPDGTTVRALKLELVRTEFCRSYATHADTEKAKKHAKQVAFGRALDAARDKAITTREIHGEEWIWPSLAPA